jgi:hypothetical protein
MAGKDTGVKDPPQAPPTPPPPTGTPPAGVILPVSRLEVRLKALTEFEQSWGDELTEHIAQITRLSDVSDDTKAFMEAYRVAPGNSKLPELRSKIERLMDAHGKVKFSVIDEAISQIGEARNLKVRQKPTNGQ